MIARELGIRRVLVPREASIFCAAGMLRSDLKHHLGAQPLQAYSTLP